jgi:hypothetical protein
VLKLAPALEPEEMKRLEPLERGNLFHQVAELFLRKLRDNGLLPVRDSEPWPTEKSTSPSPATGLRLMTYRKEILKSLKLLKELSSSRSMPVFP